ncbi:MAG: acyltransferase [Pseudomonadota bacterium]
MGSRLGQLDFLRGLALFGVIVVHTSQDFSSAIYPFLPWTIQQFDPYHLGRYGVQLFFAVSGFTMAMMYRSYLTKWAQPVKVFYVKRIFRLYPLLFVSAFAYAGIELRADARFNPDGLDTMDFVRLLTLTGGWDPHYLNVLVPGVWSIINEIYFYLLFPLLVAMIGRVSPWLIGSAVALLNVALVMGAGTGALYDGGDEWLVRDFMYRNFLVSLLCFYAGIEAYRAIHSRSRDFIGLAVPLLAAGVVMEFVEAQAGFGITSEILKVTALACLFYSLIIFSLQPPVSRFFLGRTIEKFGTVTYTGYIFHFAIIHFAAQGAMALGLMPYARFEWVMPLIVIATALSSYGVQRWTETIWQDMANALCRRFFDRRTDGGERTPTAEPAGRQPGALTPADELAGPNLPRI